MKVCARLTVFLFGVLLFCSFTSFAMAVEAVNIAVSSVTPLSAVLAVKTDIPSNVILDYGTATGQYTNSQISNGQIRHELPLNGLTAGTAIYYRLTLTSASNASDTIVIPEKFFITAHLPGQPFSFAVAGDNRPQPSSPIIQPLVWGTIAGQMAAEDLDLVLHGGDIITATSTDTAVQNEEKYDAFFSVTTPLTQTTPMYTVVGNHELIFFSTYRYGYEQEFTLPVNNGADAATDGEEYYSFNNGDTHFIVLCTELPGSIGYIGSNQMLWLEQDLQSNDRKWTVIVFHRPLFNGTHAGDPWVDIYNTTGQQNKAALLSLFKQYGVDVVFEGHEHFYMHHIDSGIQYVISGGGGAPLYGLPAFGQGDIYGASSYNHVKVDVTPDSLNVIAIDAGGSMLESFTLGSLGLGISNTAIYWNSYSDYLTGLLSVDYALSNSGPGDAASLNVVYLTSTNGVMPVTTIPLDMGALKAGQSVPVTVQYLIPPGVNFFRATTYITSSDLAGTTYALPAPAPAL